MVYIHWLLVVVVIGRETDSKNRLELDVEEKRELPREKRNVASWFYFRVSLLYFASRVLY